MLPLVQPIERFINKMNKLKLGVNKIELNFSINGPGLFEENTNLLTREGSGWVVTYYSNPLPTDNKHTVEFEIKGIHNDMSGLVFGIIPEEYNDKTDLDTINSQCIGFGCTMNL